MKETRKKSQNFQIEHPQVTDKENLLEDIPQENTNRLHMLTQEVLRHTQKNILNNSSSELYGACQHFERDFPGHAHKYI